MLQGICPLHIEEPRPHTTDTQWRGHWLTVLQELDLQFEDSRVTFHSGALFPCPLGPPETEGPGPSPLPVHTRTEAHTHTLIRK